MQETSPECPHTYDDLRMWYKKLLKGKEAGTYV